MPGVLTLVWRRDCDGLCRELVIKVARVRLGGHLWLERWNKLMDNEDEGRGK